MDDIDDLETALDNLKLELFEAQDKQRTTRLQAAIGALKIKIKKAKQEGRAKHPVTDHAVVRYLERVHGVDITRLKDLIFDRHVRDELDKGNRYINSAGHVFIVSPDKHLVTVIAPSDANRLSERAA